MTANLEKAKEQFRQSALMNEPEGKKALLQFEQ